jgi:hypothetical protein
VKSSRLERAVGRKTLRRHQANEDRCNSLLRGFTNDRRSFLKEGSVLFTGHPHPLLFVIKGPSGGPMK